MQSGALESAVRSFGATQEVTQSGFLGIANSHTGSQARYDVFCSEAKRLGADDIINIRIDCTDESFPEIFDWLVGCTEKCAYTANTLAI